MKARGRHRDAHPPPPIPASPPARLPPPSVLGSAGAVGDLPSPLVQRRPGAEPGEAESARRPGAAGRRGRRGPGRSVGPGRHRETGRAGGPARLPQTLQTPRRCGLQKGRRECLPCAVLRGQQMAGSQLNLQCWGQPLLDHEDRPFPVLACTHLGQTRTPRSGLGECLNKTGEKGGRRGKNRARGRRVRERESNRETHREQDPERRRHTGRKSVYI